jgi:hypothetical protein
MGARKRDPTEVPFRLCLRGSYMVQHIWLPKSPTDSDERDAKCVVGDRWIASDLDGGCCGRAWAVQVQVLRVGRHCVDRGPGVEYHRYVDLDPADGWHLQLPGLGAQRGLKRRI